MSRTLTTDSMGTEEGRPAALHRRIAHAWHKRTVSLKAVAFAAIGLVNTVVDYCVFLLARAAYEAMPPVVVGLGAVAAACHCSTPQTLLLIAANVTSWAVAVSCSYVMNSSITFAAESGRRLRWAHYGAFIAVGVAGLIANTAMLVFAAQILLLPIYVAKAMAVAASFAVNFSLSHFVVFPAGGKRAG